VKKDREKDMILTQAGIEYAGDPYNDILTEKMSKIESIANLGIQTDPANLNNYDT